MEESEHFDEEGMICLPTIRREIAGRNSRGNLEKEPQSGEGWGNGGRIVVAFAAFQSSVGAAWRRQGSQRTGVFDV